MANLFQAYRNIKKYGLGNAIQGAIRTPGGYLDATPSNPNVAEAIKNPSAPGSRLASQNYFDPRTGKYTPFPVQSTQTAQPQPPQIGNPEQQGQLPESQFTTTGGSGGGTQTNQFAPLPGQEGYTSQIVYFNGQPYDINDPQVREQLYGLRSSQADQYANQDITNYDKQIKDALEAASTQFGDQTNTIGRNLADIEQNRTNYGNDYNSNVEGLNQGYDVGTVNRANYFGRLSPNAYQSSQADSQAFANDQRNKGLGDLQSAKTNYFSGLDQQAGDLNTQKQRLADAYNKYTQDTQNGIGQQHLAIQNQYNQLKDQYGTELAAGNAQQNVQGFDYSGITQPYNPLQAQQVDLSQYTPYTTFSQLASSPQANSFQQYLPNPQAQQTAQDSYLGYTPDQKSKNYISQYLQKGY